MPRTCPNESPHKTLADGPKAVAAFKSLFQQPGSSLLKARNAKQREKASKRAAEKRAKQIQETAANPVAPERESTIDNPRAVVNHDAIQKAKLTGTAGRQRGEYTRNKSKVPNVGSYDCVREVTGLSLHVEDGELKCKACRTTLLL